MAKRAHLNIFLTLIFCSLLFQSAKSQNQKYFIITGKIIGGSEVIEEGLLQITKKDKSTLEFPIPTDGRFRLELDYNAEYSLTVMRKGYIPKTILVDTTVPQEVLNRPANFPDFLMAVRLFKNIQDRENLNPGTQVQQIIYSPEEGSFTKKISMYDIKKTGKNKFLANQIA
jgi:hypothetical protein